MPSQEFLHRKGSVWERYDFPNHSIAEARAEMEKMAQEGVKSYEDVTWESGTCGELSGKWIRPQNARDEVIYYIHGGGFTHGSSGIPLPFLMEMAHRLHITAFSADYRLAPEHTFPAAPEDALKGYKGLLALGYQPQQIIVCGESAGATLTLDLHYLCQREGITPPKALIAMSPVTDCIGASNGTVIEGLKNSDEVIKVYAPGEDPANPLISPALGDLKDCPPVFLTAGGDEILMRDSLVFAKAAAESGVDVHLLIGKDMIHTYPLDLWDYPEAMEAFESMELFIRQQFGMK